MSQSRTIAGFFSSLLLIGAAWNPVGAQEQGSGLRREEQIQVQKRAVQTIPILLEDFAPGPGATPDDAKAVFRVLSDDLEFSGYFTIVRIPRMAPGDTMNARAQALVRGTVELAGGQIVLHGVLESLPGRSRIFSRDYGTRPDWYREAAHRYADDIVLFLTGEPGIARTKIAFVSNKSGNKEIYVVDYDGQGLRQVTKNKSINLSPAWSPDGRQLAYVSFKKGDSDVFVIDLVTGGDRLVAGGHGVQGAPSFSPDGASILYSHTEGRESEIFLVPAAGGKPRRVTRQGGINTSPSWSPDGRRLVFTSDRSGNPQLYVTDVDGGVPRRLTFLGSWNDLASWSPQGDRVAYASRQEGGFRVGLVDPSGLGEEKLLTVGPGSDEHPSWAPNGRHLVYSSTRGGGSGLYVLHADSGRSRVLVEGGGSYAGATWSGVPAR